MIEITLCNQSSDFYFIEISMNEDVEMKVEIVEIERKTVEFRKLQPMLYLDFL